jgi:DNA modification methylase
MKSYDEFLRSKARHPEKWGKPCGDIHPSLFPFQSAIVRWAVEKGRAAIFAGCGMGKTRMQIEWARQLGARTLFLAPLAVAHQTVAEAKILGMDLQYRRAEDPAAKFVITNYEMLKAMDPSAYGAVVLDESSILKSFMGKTKRAIIEAFSETPYRLACTATPAPNDHMELGNHADFLGIMASNEMLARWFINDTMSAGNYRLKGHAEDSFWEWVSSWAACAEKPSDISPEFDDSRYMLPPLEVHEVKIIESITSFIADERGAAAYAGDAQLSFVRTASLSATQIWRDKRETCERRCAEVAKLVAAEPDEAWTIWCDTNDEADELKSLLPGSVEVRGSDSILEKERKLSAFSDGSAKIMISKPEIAGWGLNWQHSARVVFVGLTYSFERVYQALRRSYRFGQSRPVHAFFVVTESEGNVMATVKAKEAEHQRMLSAMVRSTQVHGMKARQSEIELVHREIKSAEGIGWKLYNGDCVRVAEGLPSDSVDFSVYSPPFSNLYIYSDSEADMGNSSDHAEFFEHYAWLIRENLRITKPGRLCAVHCKDLPLYKGRDGAAGLYDFPGDIIQAYSEAGWTYHSRVTIWKDPVTEMQRTKNHGLLHKNFTGRRECVRQGMADFLLVFRKWTPDMPDGQIQGMPKPGEYEGEEPPTEWNDEVDYSIQVWQRYASPVWFDIRQTDVLDYEGARDEKDERHICPLQLGVIRKALALWSQKGDLVFSPFTGIGSEGVSAIKMGRRFVGAELKPNYWNIAVKMLTSAAEAAVEPDLFSALPLPLLPGSSGVDSE